MILGTPVVIPEEEEMTRFTRMVGLFSVMAALVALPAAAHAQDNNPNDPAGPGGCHHTDKDGYDIPIHDGETVFVDGKLVTCKGGTIIITTAPLSVRPGKKLPKRLTTVSKVKTTTVTAKR
jgi:hypothetical protein